MVTGEAGIKLVDSEVDKFHCGTPATGWISGGHPDASHRCWARGWPHCQLPSEPPNQVHDWRVNVKVINWNTHCFYFLVDAPNCDPGYCTEWKMTPFNTPFDLGPKMIILMLRFQQKPETWPTNAVTCPSILIPSRLWVAYLTSLVNQTPKAGVAGWQIWPGTRGLIMSNNKLKMGLIIN